MAFLSFGSLTTTSHADNLKMLSDARALREAGKFREAKTALAKTLNEQTLAPEERKKVAYEIDLLERIRQDFSFSKEDLFGRLAKSVKDLQRAEFETWLKNGWFESRNIDGEERFTGTSVSNLYFRHSELNARRTDGKNKEAYYRALLENCRKIKALAAQEDKALVFPHHFKMTMTVTADRNAAPDGETVRAWLPIPRSYSFQKDFKLLNSSSPAKYVADETSSLRSIYLEQTSSKDQPTPFQISYEYTRYAMRFSLRPEEVKPFDLSDPVFKQFTREAPHAIFTDKIKKLGAKIVGGETNPVRKARAIYDWVGTNLLYSYALEYSTIPNISDYAITKGYGDCGQQALTFITLCRQQGIPARWQSGWYLFPHSKNIHDWAEIYLPPWGWVPVDAEFGSAILHYATSLKPEERKELADFYFGGLDQYRMAANCDHSQELQPSKKTWRSDDVDFQRGELEYGNKNIYFDQYSYDMQIEQLSPK